VKIPILRGGERGGKTILQITEKGETLNRSLSQGEKKRDDEVAVPLVRGGPIDMCKGKGGVVGGCGLCWCGGGGGQGGGWGGARTLVVGSGRNWMSISGGRREMQ